MAPAIISRKEARAQGLKRFFTGIPCKNGHVEERITSSGSCLRCVHPVLKRTEERRAAARERDRQRCRAYYADNREAIAEKARQKLAARTEEERQREAESFRKWYLENQDSVKARVEAWQKANPEKVSVFRRNKHAKRKAAEGSFTPADIQRILKDQKGKCALCRVKLGADYHIDHIQPLARGGSNWPRNLQILCIPCNKSKHARDQIKHMQSKGYLL